MADCAEREPLAPRPAPLKRALTQLFHLPKNDPVDVIFEDITLKVSIGPLFKKNEKEILKGLSGRFRSGELTSIMGPSGSGKSALLNVLTGFHNDGMKGKILSSTMKRVNDKPTVAQFSREECCYIMQDDNLTPLLTVLEVMWMAAEFKLEQTLSKKAKKIVVDNVIDNLGLNDAVATRCGLLSGGQRKRLSLALELISNPPVMFLDEPTTGLDSMSTFQLVTLLKSLAHGGRTIICTIHQPSASVFEMFDHFYVIGGGYCVYQGSSSNMVPFLNSVGQTCPQYHNPADFMLDMVCGEFGDNTQQLVDAATNSIWRSDPRAISGLVSDCSTLNTVVPPRPENPPSEWYRFRILIRRSCTLMFRDWTVVHLKFFIHLVVGLMVGAIFTKCGIDGDKSVNNAGYCMCCAVYLSYTSLMPAILKFPPELGVIKKEQFNGWYKLRTYYIAFQITNLPMQMLFSVQFVAISYYMTSQIMELERFLMFLLVNVIVIVISECIGLGLGTSINPVNGIFLGAAGMCFMILMAGFLALFKDMPRVLYYMAYMSYLRYALEGMVLSIYSYGRKNLSCDTMYCHFRSPLALLDELDMRYSDYWQDVYALILIAVLSFGYAYYSLRYKMVGGR